LENFSPETIIHETSEIREVYQMEAKTAQHGLEMLTESHV
jgi:hypothetical protein